VKIRLKFTLGLLWSAILPLACGMALSLWHVTDQTRTQTLAMTEQVLAVSCERLDGHFQRELAILQALAVSNAVRALDWQRAKPALRARIEEGISRADLFIMGRRDGLYYNTLVGNPYQGELVTMDDRDPQATPRHLREREYWRRLIADNVQHERRAVISAPLVSYTTGKLHIVAAVTVHDDSGQVIGLLGAGLPWGWLMPLLNQLQEQVRLGDGLTPRFLLVAPTGAYWYHWDSTRLAHGEPAPHDGEPAHTTHLITAESDSALAAAGRAMLAGQRGVALYPDPATGAGQVMVYGPIGSTGYALGMVIPERELYRPVRQQQGIFVGTAALAVALVVLLAWFAARRITTPILSLRQAAAALAEGRGPPLVAPRGDDELRDLTATFNTMAATLSQREADLRAIHERFELAMRGANEGLWDWHLPTNSIYLSPRWKTMLGFAESEIANDRAAMLALLHPDDVARVTRAHEDYLAGRLDHFDLEYRMRRKDGGYAVILSRGFAVRDAATGVAQRLVGTHVDISAQKRSERQLRELNQSLEQRVEARTAELALANRELAQEVQERGRAEAALRVALTAAESANRAKSIFLANMSHEIRTPMNAILGYTQLLQRNPQVSAAQREHLDIIARSGEHLLDLINDILALSKIEAGQEQLANAAFPLAPLCQELLQMFRFRAQDKGLTLDLELDPHLPPRVVADESKLKQILINLLGNAIKFTPRGGVTLQVVTLPGPEADHLRLVIAVRDTGVGIAEADLERIFDAFVQGKGLDLATGGTGLGLAISRRYARLMGGELTAESQLGVGSTFCLTVPVQMAVPGQAEPAAPPLGQKLLRLRPDHPGQRILIVDDQEANRTILTELLGSVGFATREAANGAEALAAIAAWQPHAVLLDWRMPVMSGQEVMEHLRAAPPAHPMRVIVVSASALEEDRQAILDQGADGYIAKPYHMEEITTELQRQLGLEYETVAADATGQDAAQWTPDELRRRLAALPAPLRDALRVAVQQLDLHQLRTHLPRVAEADAPLADHLGLLAGNYDYDTLLLHLGEPPAG
jgi:PAS domain S-box-containing protein